MKKLIVDESELSQQTSVEIEQQLTSHFMYGLYEFNPERMIDEVCRKHNLKLLNIQHPLYFLEDDDKNKLQLKFVTDEY